jgi:deoxyribose-phosphate aldolase
MSTETRATRRSWASFEVAACIQHTLLRTDTTRDDLERHCRECIDNGFDAAMVAGNWLPVAEAILRGSSVKLASAVDFPLGIMSTRGKVAEAAALRDLGAVELDVMVNVGWLRSGMEAAFRDDIAAVVEAARPARVKVMLELPLLSPAQRERAIVLAVEAGVAWVKNASSSAVEVASPESIRFLRERVPAEVGVKASGGIKSLAQAVALLRAGADLLGTSAGVAIVQGTSGASSY